MKQAFEGVRVIDFTQVLSGPVATANMALLGADVIKFEMKGIGDQTRNLMAEGEWAHLKYFFLCYQYVKIDFKILVVCLPLQ